MTAGTQNDSATPRAAAWAMADDANTIRRRTTCTPRNPSRAPARPPARIASLKIPQVGEEVVPGGGVSLTASPVSCGSALGPASDEPGVDVLEVGRGPHRGRGGRERHAVIAIEEERVVGPLEAVLDQVGHHHDGGAPHLAEALDEVEHLLLGGRVERGGRLVEEDEIGVGRERPRHEHALPLPARKVAQLPPLQGLDARLGERGPRAAEVRPRVRQRHVAGPLQAHEHEVEDRDREDGVERRLLRNVGEAEARPRVRWCRRRDGRARGPCGRRSTCRRRSGPMTAHSSPAPTVSVSGGKIGMPSYPTVSARACRRPSPAGSEDFGANSERSR